jgi:hypothetical protein
MLDVNKNKAFVATVHCTWPPDLLCPQTDEAESGIIREHDVSRILFCPPRICVFFAKFQLLFNYLGREEGLLSSAP